MAFREQYGFDVGREEMAWLESHEDCVIWWTVSSEHWREANFSLGRLLRLMPARRRALREACRRWTRRRAGFEYVPENLVFVTLKNRRAKPVRIAVFRYRGHVTQALKEHVVHRVMTS